MDQQLDSGIKNKYVTWRWRIFAITWLSYVGYYFTRKAFSVAKVGILADPDIEMTTQMMGNIDAAYLIFYAVGQFIWGVSGDKFGPRLVISCGMFLSICTCVAMGFSTAAFMFAILFAIQGLCQSTGWAPLSKNVSQWFSQHERGRVFGFWCTNYAFGGFAASPFAGFIASTVFDDWRWAFFAPSIVLMTIWILFIIFQRNRPEDIGLPAIEELHGEAEAVIDEDESPDEEPEGSWHTIGEVFKNPIVLVLGLVYFLQKPARYAILFWGPVFVARRLNTDSMGASAYISTAFEFAGLMSPIAAGYLSDKLFQSRRMPVAIISLSLLSIILFLFDPLTGGKPLDGPANFKFTLITKEIMDGKEVEVSYWSNDGTSKEGGEPEKGIELNADDGKVNIKLGDQELGMIGLPEVNKNKKNPLYLRTWVDQGEGFQKYGKDTKIGKINNFKENRTLKVFSLSGGAIKMVVVLFIIGFLLYGPDSLISGTAAVDFGTKKGASTSAGFINGCGSIGAVLGGLLPGYITDEGLLFQIFAVAVLLSAIILLPIWNRLPSHSKTADEK